MKKMEDLIKSGSMNPGTVWVPDRKKSNPGEKKTYWNRLGRAKRTIQYVDQYCVCWSYSSADVRLSSHHEWIDWKDDLGAQPSKDIMGLVVAYPPMPENELPDYLPDVGSLWQDSNGRILRINEWIKPNAYPEINYLAKLSVMNRDRGQMSKTEMYYHRFLTDLTPALDWAANHRREQEKIEAEETIDFESLGIKF